MEIRDFTELLTSCEAFISYVPLPGEPDPAVLLPSSIPSYVIQPRADLAPEAEAVAAMTAAGELHTAVLIPGQRFDATGTRHGRGGGWYDRFLAQVPEEWLRIGVCAPEQFSNGPLTRESWDQPVDYVGILDPDTGTIVHVTGARTH